MSSRLVVVLWSVGAVLSGCSFDTELGVDAEISSASVTVAPDNVVSVVATVSYRVGDYADSTRDFQPQGIELFAGGSQVAAMVPSAPPGFVSRVAPGESFTATFMASDAAPTGPRQLCGADVRVLFRWLDTSSSEIGMTEANTGDVTCE